MKPEEAAAALEKDLTRAKELDIRFYPCAVENVRALLDAYREVKRVGVWRPVGFDKRGRGGVWVCSSCKRCHPLKSDFCPMCGADMRGPEPGGEQPVAYGAPFDEPIGEA